MAKLGISTGLIPDDGTGDSLLEGAIKINKNFNEIYNYFGNGTNLTFTNIWSSNNSGVHTLSNVGIGTTIPTEKLTVFGSARITGILTVGSSSITIDGNNNIIRVGSGVTINGLTGAISVSSINIGGSTINGIGVTFITAGSGISVNKNTGNVVITATGANWSTTSVGINTLSRVGVGTTNARFTLEVGSVGSSGTSLHVNGGLRVTGSSILNDLSASGIITASSFVGDGSALTGIVASGSGIVINDDGSNIGTAGTINFGSNLSVSPVSAGVVTITASGGNGSSQWVSTSAGIHTLSKVGVGTTNPTSSLTVVGNSLITGVSTFINDSTFSGTAKVVGNLFVGNSGYYITEDLSGNIEYYYGSTGKTLTHCVATNSQLWMRNPGKSAGSNEIATFKEGGSVDLYFNASKKFETTNTGITVTGGISATGNILLNSVSAERSIGFNNGSTNVYFYQVTSGDRNGHTGMFDGTNNRYIWRYYPIFDSFVFDRIVSITDTPASTSLTGTSSQKLQVTSGAYISGNTGIGITNPTEKLQVSGVTSTSQLYVTGTSTLSGNTFVGSGITMYASTGIISATTFYGNLIGSIDSATNLTGGYANASTLNVSGIATISQGRIQADASSNLRFGNLPAGSGSGRNIAIGDQVLSSLSGGLGRNIGIGELAFNSTSSGEYNIGIGARAGQLITSGSYNVILGYFDGNSNNLDIRTSSNNVVIADGQGNIRQYINSSGNVGIKTTIITEALTVAGIVSATGFYGSLNAGQLTGALPAIDGSALVGVVATGSGVEIRDDGSVVGTAATIDFGNNINVSFASGIATVSASIPGINTSGTSAFNQLNVSGISTFNGAIDVNSTSNFQENVTLQSNLILGDNDEIQLGAGSNGDLIITHLSATNNSLIRNKNTSGSFIIDTATGSPIEIRHSSGGEPMGIFTPNGSVSLYYDNIKKFETTGYGVSVYGGINAPTGIITAASFSGSASGLTNIPAGQLTGNLPAIDGSALLNVNATGSGIVILDDNANVGSARTVNFGSGLDVTYSTSGIATISASGGSLQSRTIVTGVTTSISNNGIGNTNITGFKSYALMKVGLSTAGWLRIYTDSTSRANDVSRSVGEDPAPGSGVIAEVITTGISTTQIISPFVMGGNLDNPADTTIYVAITNLSGSTQAITANLTILQLEA